MTETSLNGGARRQSDAGSLRCCCLGGFLAHVTHASCCCVKHDDTPVWRGPTDSSRLDSAAGGERESLGGGVYNPNTTPDIRYCVDKNLKDI